MATVSSLEPESSTTTSLQTAASDPTQRAMRSDSFLVMTTPDKGSVAGMVRTGSGGGRSRSIGGGTSTLPAMTASASSPRPLRVLHFVTGGFSGGATQVAVQLVNAARDGGAMDPLLVLRRKRRTPPARIAELREQGVPLQLVPGWSHLATVIALV